MEIAAKKLQLWNFYSPGLCSLRFRKFYSKLQARRNELNRNSTYNESIVWKVPFAEFLELISWHSLDKIEGIERKKYVII